MGKLAVKFHNVSIIQHMSFAINDKLCYAKIERYSHWLCIVVISVRDNQPTTPASLFAVIGQQTYVTASINALAKVIKSYVEIARANLTVAEMDCVK
ncbi:hypothetical protein E5S67_05926 [Microcoleus sp. IPMA8]|uniref:Uncharacterized protein n=1 Tax=Microcoleus asticus IPMA8 TaxID=2563858 RepID=A0ABX2D663_9CYAN|nr:hypothetical protein [Microcoleus asticus IPMA8]